MSKPNLKIVVLALLGVLVVGAVIGVALPVDAVRKKVAELISSGSAADDDDHADESHADEEVVEISNAAMENLKIRFGRVKSQPYQTSYEIPARVSELPGVSELHVVSRFEGIVKKVLVSQGQTVVPGQKLFELELTSESLATAQADLLFNWQQIGIINDEIKRLTPLVDKGGVARKRLIDLGNELKRVQARLDAKNQELLVRGLSENQLQKIKTDKQLIRKVTVHVGDSLLPPQRTQLITDPQKMLFVVGNIMGQPGAMVKTGAQLCDLAYHQHLVVVGYAFEQDLPQIEKLIRENIAVKVDIGGKTKHEELEGQQIAYVSNHADAETNTFPFMCTSPTR